MEEPKLVKIVNVNNVDYHVLGAIEYPSRIDVEATSASIRKAFHCDKVLKISSLVEDKVTLYPANVVQIAEFEELDNNGAIVPRNEFKERLNNAINKFNEEMKQENKNAFSNSWFKDFL